MRTLYELCDLLHIDEETGQAVLRARDAFASSYALESMQYSAIEDYLLGVTLAIGRDAKNNWRFSPVMFYNLMTAVLVLQNIGQWIEELAEKVSSLNLPVQEEEWADEDNVCSE